MGKYLRIKATGKIGEYQGKCRPGTLIKNAGLTEAEAEEVEGTYADWEAARANDPNVIQEKLKAEDDTILVNQKVLKSIIFEIFNMVRKLQSKPEVTMRQFLDNLQARR